VLRGGGALNVPLAHVLVVLRLECPLCLRLRCKLHIRLAARPPCASAPRLARRPLGGPAARARGRAGAAGRAPLRLQMCVDTTSKSSKKAIKSSSVAEYGSPRRRVVADCTGGGLASSSPLRPLWMCAIAIRRPGPQPCPWWFPEVCPAFAGPCYLLSGRWEALHEHLPRVVRPWIVGPAQDALGANSGLFLSLCDERAVCGCQHPDSEFLSNKALAHDGRSGISPSPPAVLLSVGTHTLLQGGPSCAPPA